MKRVVSKTKLEAISRKEKAEESEARHSELKTSLDAVVKAVEKTKPNDIAPLLKEGNKILTEVVEKADLSKKDFAKLEKKLETELRTGFKTMTEKVVEAINDRPTEYTVVRDKKGYLKGVKVIK